MPPVTCRPADSWRLSLAAAPTPAFGNHPHDTQTMPAFSSPLSQRREPVPQQVPDKSAHCKQVPFVSFHPKAGARNRLPSLTAYWGRQPKKKKAMKFPTVWSETFSQSGTHLVVAAAAKSRQLCPTLCDPRQQPTRLHHPQDSPGKNTGVDCHFLLHQKLLTDCYFCLVSKSCPILLQFHGLPASSVHGISQARILE